MKPINDVNSAAPETPGGTTSWRAIPVTLLGGLGGLMIVIGLMSLFAAAYAAWTGNPLYFPGPTAKPVSEIAVGVIGLLGGGMLFFSAIQCWRGQWMTALVLVSTINSLLKLMGVWPP